MMLELAMGNDVSPSTRRRGDGNSMMVQFKSTSRRRGNTMHNGSGSRTSVSSVYIAYIICILSWVSALYLSGQTKTQINSLQSLQEAIDHQYQSELVTLKDLEIKIRDTKIHVEGLINTREALEHEIQVAHELEEVEEPMSMMPSNRALVDTWLRQRQNTLRHRMEYLQRYLQSFSKQQVLERWGEGPHRVAFTVEYKDEARHLNNRQIVVELASVHDMPHSVHFFLEMIESRIWDHTVLLHHENIEHLIAAVPIDFRQQLFKHSHLTSLGWTKLGFPEYHPKYAHQKYTIGFANGGPTWYWNTIDNSATHGPGGHAAQKLLDEDADPCIARVIQGHDVVDDLIEYGLHQHQVEFEQGHPWADEPHTWTHLVKAEIVQTNG